MRKRIKPLKGMEISKERAYREGKKGKRDRERGPEERVRERGGERGEREIERERVREREKVREIAGCVKNTTYNCVDRDRNRGIILI